MINKNLKFAVHTNLSEQEAKKQNKQKPDSLNNALIKFDGQLFVVNVAEELQINEKDMISSMVQHAGNYGWWASLNTTSRKLLRKLKKEVESERCKLDGEARSSLKEEGLKVTEEGVRAWLNSDPRTTKFNEEISALEDLVEYSDVILKALEHKRDMLKEINKAQLKDYYNERQ